MQRFSFQPCYYVELRFSLCGEQPTDFLLLAGARLQTRRARGRRKRRRVLRPIKQAQLIPPQIQGPRGKGATPAATATAAFPSVPQRRSIAPAPPAPASSQARRCSLGLHPDFRDRLLRGQQRLPQPRFLRSLLTRSQLLLAGDVCGGISKGAQTIAGATAFASDL